MNLANPKLGKHQYFRVPAHVARRHCLAGNIDEPERRQTLAALCPRFFNCRTVDATGIEPVHPRLTTPLWKIEGRSCASCDSFPDYRSANQAGGGRTPFADAESAVSGSHKPRPSSRSLKNDQRLPKRFSSSATAFLAAVPSFPAWEPSSASFRRSKSESFSPPATLVKATFRSETFHVGIRDLHPLPAASCGSRKELTPLSNHAFVRSMVRT